jgi:hypothetical protein
MTVRGLVLRATNVALRVHGGAVVGNGDWPPILDRGVWEQVKAILADPARKTSTGTVAKHLLSGIARCGVCGGPMRVALRTYGGGGHGKHANRPRCSRRLSPSRLRSRSWNPPSPTPRRHERRSTGRTWRAWTIGTRSRTYEGIKHVDMVPILSPDRSPSTLIQRGLHTMRRGDCARGEPSAPGSWPRGT